MNIEDIRHELAKLLKDSGTLWNSSGSHEAAEYMFYEIERLYEEIADEKD